MHDSSSPPRRTKLSTAFHWLIRIAAGGAALCAIALAGLATFYFAVVSPREKAEAANAEREAQAFGKLRGPARRLAIYDRFVAQIDHHYYDQTFAGFDWAEMRRAWRPKAAAAIDDFHLYADVLWQMVQRFPVSHMNVSPPALGSPQVGPRPPSDLPEMQPFCGGYADLGMQIVPLHQKGRGAVVGEVGAGSPAAMAGVTPGWRIESFRETISKSGGQFEAVFLSPTLAQMHQMESPGFPVTDAGKAERTRHDRPPISSVPRVHVRFSFACRPSQAGVAARRLPSGAMYVRFDRFSGDVIDQVRKAIALARPAGVILDLRFNEGGYPLLLLNMLLPRHEPVYRVRGSSGFQIVRTDLWTRRYYGPLAVLAGPGSTSAAEVTAAVLKHERRAVVIGRTTNGSVLGAGFYMLPDGGTVEMPVQDIEMLDGARIEGRGVGPNFEIFPSNRQIRHGVDEGLELAERYLQKRGR